MCTTARNEDFIIFDGILKDFTGDPKSVIELVIPTEVKEFSDKFKDRLYHDMTNVRKVTVQKGNLAFSSHCGVLYDKNMETLLFYPRAKRRKSYRMPDTVKTVADMAFANSSLWSVDMPETLESIGKKAFANTNLVCPTLPTNLKTLAKDAFKGCERLHILNIPDKDIIITKDDLDLSETTIVLVETFEPIDHSKYAGLNVMNEEEFNKWLEE